MITCYTANYQFVHKFVQNKDLVLCGMRIINGHEKFKKYQSY
jgi:hypothetical protein